MKELEYFQSYFNQVKRNFSSEGRRLEQNENDAFLKFYRCVDRLWNSNEKPCFSAPSIDKSVYLDYCQKFRNLYDGDYKNGSEINIWAIAGLKDDEVRNTAALGWWLNKYESHGFGSELLEQVVKDHLNVSDTATLLSFRNEEYKVRCESLPLREIENRIDLEIVSDSFLMFWEVKINASEGKNGQQLATYERLLSRKAKMMVDNQSRFLIYLTKHKTNLSHLGGSAYSLTWGDIKQSFLEVYRRQPSQCLNKLPSQLLYQYCEYIERFKS